MGLGHPCYSYLTIVTLCCRMAERRRQQAIWQDIFVVILTIPVLCSGRLEKNLLKEGEVWWKILQTKLILSLSYS